MIANLLDSASGTIGFLARKPIGMSLLPGLGTGRGGTRLRARPSPDRLRQDRRYSMAIVTAALPEALPTERLTGTATPDGTRSFSITFTWITPWVNPGAPPA